MARDITGLSVALRLSGETDIAFIRYALQRVSCGGEPIEPFSLLADRALEDIRLPGGIPEFEDAPFDGSSSHTFADFFVDLAPGCYVVSTHPLEADKGVSRICAPASNSSVRILDGQTTEVFLVHQCQGQGRGAIDVVAALNHPPEMVSLAFTESKFVLSCQEQRVCATVKDPEGDPVEFSWEQVSGAELNVAPEVVESRTNADGSFTECILTVAETPGRYELKVTAFDKLKDAGSGLWVRFEEYLASRGNPQPSRVGLTFPFYAAAGNGGACRSRCTHPSVETLAAHDPIGVSDIVFDANCNAYLSTIISGLDYVYKIDASGVAEIITGYSNYNIPTIALEPVSGNLVVGHNDNSRSSVGVQSGSAITVLASGAYTQGSLWSNYYLNQCASSIAVDDSGCIWTPNFAGNGTLVCVDIRTSNQHTALSLGGRIEGISWTASQGLLLSVDEKLFATNTSTGTTSVRFAAPSPILDFAVDTKNGDIYMETVAGQILRLASGGQSTVFASVQGQGKLAISPDRYLVRVVPAPGGTSSYQEWALGL